MTPKKIIIPVFLIISCVIGTIIFINQNNSETSTPDIIISTDSNSSSNHQNIDSSIDNPNQIQKLTIIPQRCIGCGKCARIDSAHFEINGRTATVISSTNLSSQNLATAINICPVQAIVLE